MKPLAIAILLVLCGCAKKTLPCVTVERPAAIGIPTEYPKGIVCDEACQRLALREADTPLDVEQHVRHPLSADEAPPYPAPKRRKHKWITPYIPGDNPPSDCYRDGNPCASSAIPVGDDGGCVMNGAYAPERDAETRPLNPEDYKPPIWNPLVLSGQFIPNCQYWDESTQKVDGHYGTEFHIRCKDAFLTSEQARWIETLTEGKAEMDDVRVPIPGDDDTPGCAGPIKPSADGRTHVDDRWLPLCPDTKAGR